MNIDMTDRYPFLEPERELIAAAVASRVPVLGICLGGQMLARALGHPVRPAGIREIGFKPLRPTPQAAADPLFSLYEDGDTVFHWHQDTFELPEGRCSPPETRSTPRRSATARRGAPSSTSRSTGPSSTCG